MMNCRLVERLLSAYVDGELDGVTMINIRHHIVKCPNCNCEHEGFVKIKHELGNMTLHRPKPEFEIQLLAKVLKHEQPDTLSAKFQNWVSYNWNIANAYKHAWVAASVLVVAFSGWLLTMASELNQPEMLAGGERAVSLVQQGSTQTADINNILLKQNPNSSNRIMNPLRFLHDGSNSVNSSSGYDSRNYSGYTGYHLSTVSLSDR